MNIRKLETDADLAENGIWVEYEDAKFHIRSTNSKKFRKVTNRLAQKKNPNRLQKDAEAQHEISIEALAEGIIIGWENVNDNGTPLEATVENKMRICQIEDLRNFLAGEARNFANFQNEAVAADASQVKSED